MAEQQKALTSRSAAFAGLGDFTAETLLESVKDQAATKGSATADEIRDAMGNVIPRLERFKVKHGGACIIVDEGGKKYEELLGVVVAYTYHNSFFDKPFEAHEEGERPVCFSRDGVSVDTQAEKPQAKDCTICARNRDARDREARNTAFDRDRKEACANYLSLAVILPGRDIPVQLRLSNSSFKPWAEYVQRIGTQGRFLPHEVATRFRLRNMPGAGGSEFTKVTFELAGALQPGLREAFASQRDGYRALLRREDVQRDEATTGLGREAMEAAKAESRAQAATGDVAL